MKKLLYIYIIAMVVIIFFSKTIYNFSLPSVTVSPIVSGSLEKELESYGELTFLKQYDIFAKMSGQVTKMNYEENDTVKPYSDVAEIAYSSDAMELKRAEAALSKLYLSKLQIKSEDGSSTVADLEMKELADKIKDQKGIVASQEILYQAGVLSKRDLEEEQITLRELRSQLAIKQADREAALSQLDLDIAAAEAEISMMKNGETQTVSNEAREGKLVALHVQPGEFISMGEKIATIGVVNGNFQVEIIEPKDNARFVGLQDKAQYSVNGILADAEVTSIKPEGENLKITFNVSSDQFTGGEYGKIILSKVSENYDILVPNDAVVREEYSSYVWVVKARNGSLGQEYYAVKTRVFIADYDDNNTAISRGIYSGDDVILNPPEELENNERVLPY
jgi:hypothetical protein